MGGIFRERERGLSTLLKKEGKRGKVEASIEILSFYFFLITWL